MTNEKCKDCTYEDICKDSIVDVFLCGSDLSRHSIKTHILRDEIMFMDSEFTKRTQEINELENISTLYKAAKQVNIADTGQYDKAQIKTLIGYKIQEDVRFEKGGRTSDKIKRKILGVINKIEDGILYSKNNEEDNDMAKKKAKKAKISMTAILGIL